MTKNDNKLYTREIHFRATDEMYQFLELLAARRKTNISNLIRQAVRDHLDVQDDVIGSRSRLGVRVTRHLGAIRNDLLNQLVHLGKLILAAVIVLLAKQGFDTAQVVREIKQLANSPQLDRLVRVQK